MRPADDDQGEPALGQPGQKGLVRMGQGQQGAVDVAGAQVVADEDFLFGVLGRREQEMAALAAQLPAEDGNEQHVVRVLEDVLLVFGDHEGHRARPAGGQVAGGLVDRVPERLDGAS